MKKNHSVEFQALWQDSRFNRAPLISTILLRIVIAVMFVMFVIEKTFSDFHDFADRYSRCFGRYDDVLAMAEEAIYIHGAYFYSEFAFQRCAC